jgi:hypothetical protein
MAIYRVLTGHEYFQGKSDAQIAKELTKRDFCVDLSAIINPEAKSVLSQMLQVDPSARGTTDQIMSKHFFIGGASVSGTRLVRIENTLESVGERVVQLENKLNGDWQRILRSNPAGSGGDQTTMLLKQYIVH